MQEEIEEAREYRDNTRWEIKRMRGEDKHEKKDKMTMNEEKRQGANAIKGGETEIKSDKKYKET